MRSRPVTAYRRARQDLRRRATDRQGIPGRRYDAGAVDGLNDLSIALARHAAPVARSLRVNILDAAGRAVAWHAGTARAGPLRGAPPAARLGPPTVTLSDAAPTAQLGAAGFFDDGRVFNVTAPDTGTDYRSRHRRWRQLTRRRRQRPAGGKSQVVALNGALLASAAIVVQRPAVLAALGTDRPVMTLRTVTEPQAFELTATFSDGSIQRDPALIPDLTLESAPQRRHHWRGRPGPGHRGRDGAANGPQRRVRDACRRGRQSRTPPSISGLTIDAPVGSVQLGATPVFGLAKFIGTGSLDGLAVTVTLTRGSVSTTESLVTRLDGGAAFEIDDLRSPAWCRLPRP